MATDPDRVPRRPPPSPVLARAEAALEAVERAAEKASGVSVEQRVELLATAQRALAELLAEESGSSAPQT